MNKLVSTGVLAAGLLVSIVGSARTFQAHAQTERPILAQSHSSNRCNLAVGQWLWDDREFPAAILDNGMVAAIDFGQPLNGTWSCLNRSQGRIQVVWDTGHVNTLVISSDAQSMQGADVHPSTTVVDSQVLRVVRQQ